METTRKNAQKCAVCFFMQGEHNRAQFALVKTGNERFDKNLREYVYIKK